MTMLPTNQMAAIQDSAGTTLTYKLFLNQFFSRIRGGGVLLRRNQKGGTLFWIFLLHLQSFKHQLPPNFKTK
jgi:hypothetical protein